MATNEVEKPDPLPPIALPKRVSNAVVGDDRLGLRTFIACMVAVICMVLAPLPWNIVGVVALSVVMLDLSRFTYSKGKS